MPPPPPLLLLLLTLLLLPPPPPPPQLRAPHPRPHPAPYPDATARWEVDLVDARDDLQALEFFIRDEDRYGKTAAYRANGANVTFYDRAHGLMGWLQLPKDVAVLPVPWRADLASLTTGDESA